MSTEGHAAHIKTNVTSYDWFTKVLFYSVHRLKVRCIDAHTSVRCIGEINRWIKQRSHTVKVEAAHVLWYCHYCDISSCTVPNNVQDGVCGSHIAPFQQNVQFVLATCEFSRLESNGQQLPCTSAEDIVIYRIRSFMDTMFLPCTNRCIPDRYYAVTTTAPPAILTYKQFT